MNLDYEGRDKAVEEGASYQYPGPIFIWELTINAFRAILQEVGLNRVIESIKPYNEAWGRAVVGIVKERFGPPASNLDLVALSAYYAHYCTSNGHIKPLEIREGGAIAELYACPSPGMNAPPEICLAMTHIMGESMCKAVDPRYSFIFTHHLANGDDCCRWILMKKDSKYTPENLGGFVKDIPLGLSIEEMSNFAVKMVIFSQLFTFTSASVDLVGSERTMEIEAPLAKATGVRLGSKLKGGLSGPGGLSMIQEKLDLIGSAVMQRCSASQIDGSGIQKEIFDCPFKGAPFEVCKQFEGVQNGICESIDPEFEFAYDRMMPKGDSTCHWVVRRKGIEGAKEATGPSFEDEARKLALRFGKGEITYAEYESAQAKVKRQQAAR